METRSSTDANAKPGLSNGKGRRGSAAKATLHLHEQQSTPPEELNEMIATAAYFCAERRQFEPGHELDDWLTAEREIKSRLLS